MTRDKLQKELRANAATADIRQRPKMNFHKFKYGDRQYFMFLPINPATQKMRNVNLLGST